MHGKAITARRKIIPLELYFFTKVKDRIYYENVQADIFDHVMAIIDQFDLRVFQYPASSYDSARMSYRED